MKEKTFRKMVESLNSHIPEERKTLSSLLSESRPMVRGKDGSIHVFKKKELDKIAEIVPKGDYDRLLLPIYIEMNSEYGRGAGRIVGKINCDLVKKILGERYYYERDDEIILYANDIGNLRRILPTTTQYIFAIPI
ncbi:MAG TPA: DUF61 family protein [Halobacteria archaeon]|jgi:hypothetical protein|nr:DUF61 family protein [Halobacteria archaeon]HIH78090.1 DUF61 family protein [Halobacteria archaeon]